VEFGNDYIYQLVAVSYNGSESIVFQTGKLFYNQETTGNIVKGFNLSQNYPNPFNPNTVIPFHVPFGTNIKIKVYTVTGELVEILENKYYEAGEYSVEFINKNSYSSGIYICQLESMGFTKFIKMTLMK